MNDWKGNRKTTFVTLGASNHSEAEREENDYYATEPKAIDLLVEQEVFNGVVWENACGEGHLSERLKHFGITVISSDLINRGYGQTGVDFFEIKEAYAPNIVTNPPYRYAKEWVEHSMDLLPDSGKLALFLPIQFLESNERREMFKKYPPKTVYVCVNRILCGKNGDFRAKDKQGNVIYKRDGTPKRMSSAKCYAWFVWIKGYSGNTSIKWIN